MQVLEGIKVVDLSTAYSAPHRHHAVGRLRRGGHQNRKYGRGDGSRSWNPSVNGQGIHFLYMNRNKKSVALNLKSPEGSGSSSSWYKEADIVVENFRPGVTRRLGIDYEAMRAVKPDIIMTSLSGYGQTGPYATRGAYSNLAEALSGLMYVTGWPAPEGKPTPPAWPSATCVAGMFLTQGILYALYHRERTGQGQYIDVSMVDSLVALLQHCFCPVLPDGPGAGADRQPGPVRLPLRSLRGQGRLLPVGNSTPGTGAALLRPSAAPDLGEDPGVQDLRPALGAHRRAPRHHSGSASQRTRKEIEAIFTEYGQLTPLF